MAAQAGKKGRAKRLVIAGLILAALAAAGVGLAIVSTSQSAAPDYGAGMAVENEPTRPQQPKPEAEKPATTPEPESEAEEASEEPARPLATPSANGALAVQGSQLVDAAGNPVQLRGVSTDRKSVV